MKKLIYAMAAALLCVSGCRSAAGYVATVSNDSPEARQEMVELSLESVGPGPVRVLDASGDEVPSQLTYDGLVIFPASVAASSSSTYYVVPGIAAQPDTVACGKVYPNRDDDIAWENDVVAFRAYGPAIQRKGEKMYGYDLFLKRDTAAPVLADMYAAQCSGENWRKVNALRSEGRNEEADLFVSSFTYHVDHGHGMDCYAVGPTLGAGATALLTDVGEIMFPYCYVEAEILDNGPLRFTARLRYEPRAFQGDTVVETRIITLDKGSHLNRTIVTYDGLSRPARMASGIALRDAGQSTASEAFIAYADPTQGPDNGKAYVGVVPVAEADSTAAKHPGDDASAYPAHLLSISSYAPGSAYAYYWGYGWNRSDVPTFEAWTDYLAARRRAIDSPLRIDVRKR